MATMSTYRDKSTLLYAFVKFNGIHCILKSSKINITFLIGINDFFKEKVK